MFNKKLGNDILDELKKLNSNMEQNNKLLQEVWDNTKGTKINTAVLFRINSEIMDLNIKAQAPLDTKTDDKIEEPDEVKEAEEVFVGDTVKFNGSDYIVSDDPHLIPTGFDERENTKKRLSECEVVKHE